MIVIFFDWVGHHAAEIIALCALFFTAYQAIIQRRHNILSVKPHITTFTHRNKTKTAGQLQLQLMNNGLGPAFIDRFQVYLAGERCEANAAVNSVLGDLSKNSSITTLGDDYAMRPDEIRSLLVVTFPIASDEQFDTVEQKLNKLDLEVHYSSAYGEKFVYDSRITP